MLSKMLQSLESFPIIGISVLLLLVLIFLYIGFTVYRSNLKEVFVKASRLPLEDAEKINE